LPLCDSPLAFKVEVQSEFVPLLEKLPQTSVNSSLPKAVGNALINIFCLIIRITKPISKFPNKVVSVRRHSTWPSIKPLVLELKS